MFVRCATDAVCDWSRSTLVIPAVSVGNVGQLACDLLISTLNARRVGFLYDDSVVAVVGSDPFTSFTADDRVTTAVEVFECVDSNVVVVQQRAPLIKGKQSQFVSRLVDWIVSCQFKMVVVLTSMFAYERQDAQLTGPQQRFLMSPCLESEGLGRQLMEQCGWIRLEERRDASNSESCSSPIYMPGSGVARRLYLHCSSAGVKTVVLLTFCDEGDNTQDACDLVSYLNTMTRWIPQSNSQTLSLKFPQSWQHMFGCRYDQSIFQ